MKARIVYHGEHAPRRAGLDAAIKDDEVVQHEKLSLVSFRITVVQELTDETLYHQIYNQPQALPTVVLGDVAAAQIVRTRGAIAYEAETTCVVTVPKSFELKMSEIIPPLGCFIMKQASTTTPKWFTQKGEETPKDYLKRVCWLLKEQRDLLVYRPYGRAKLGATTQINAPGMLELTKYYIKHALPTWTTPQHVADWASERGFLRVQEPTRAGPRAWLFYADPPQGVVATSFAFKSGVLVTKAVRPQAPVRQKPKEGPAPTTRNAWGAAKPRIQNIDDETVDQAASTAAPTAASTATPTTGAAEAAKTKDDVKIETKEEAKVESKSKLQRGEDGKAVGKHVTPYAKWFKVVQCAGDEDCFYIAAGRGLHHVSPSGRVPPVNAFEPKGPIQGHLRMLVQRAGLKKVFGTTKLQAEHHGTTGNPAGALAVRLLAHEAKTDIYIWAKDANGKWILYGREPNSKMKKKEIWLTLEDQHYQWLEPRADIQDLPEYQNTLRLWRDQAFPYPQHGLQGSGEEDDDDADMLSLLGLRSTPTAHTGAIASILGLDERADEMRSILGSESGGAEALAEEAAGDEDEAFKQFWSWQTGEYYKCDKCGWTPDTSGRVMMGKRKYNSLLSVQADRHWRKCQGKPAPKIGKIVHSHISQFLANSARIRENARQRGFAKHLLWKAKLPISIQEAVCEYDPRTVLTIPNSVKNYTAYKCTRCGIQRALGQAPWNICSGRHNKVTRKQFLTSTVGVSRMRHFFEVEQKRIQKKKVNFGPDKREKRRKYWAEYSKRPEHKERKRIQNQKLDKRRLRSGSERERYLIQKRKRRKEAWKKKAPVESGQMRMATINVTALNAARLEELLTHDDLKEVDFLALQE
ncbi:unnamed protein product, partial [Prorocentrum cordatum]